MLREQTSDNYVTLLPLDYLQTRHNRKTGKTIWLGNCIRSESEEPER